MPSLTLSDIWKGLQNSLHSSTGLMQKPFWVRLTNPALRVAHINASQFSISCIDMESPACPCQSEPVVLSAELPQGVSNEWLYLAQCWRTKENTALQWSMQISELHLLKVVAEWNRTNSYLDFFFLKQKGSLNTASSYFLWVWTVMEDIARYLPPLAESTDFSEADIMNSGQHRLS